LWLLAWLLIDAHQLLRLDIVDSDMETTLISLEGGTSVDRSLTLSSMSINRLVLSVILSNTLDFLHGGGEALQLGK
jgi:hypothetical protein